MGLPTTPTAEVLLDPTGHPVIGHRGASGHAPENTIPSFDTAVRLGVDAIELDVRLSRDGVPVVFHDPTLDRTTDLRGPLAALPARKLAEADAGARFSLDGREYPFRGQGHSIPLVAEVLERYPTLPMLVELKVSEAATPVAEVLRRFGATERVVVASFHHSALTPFREAPSISGASRRGIVELAVRAFVGLVPKDRGYRLFAVPIRYKDLIPVATRRFIAAAHRLGVPVHVWTVNDPKTALGLWELGANGMVTNYPDRIRPVVPGLFDPAQHRLDGTTRHDVS